MSWGCLPKTVTRMDAGAEPPGKAYYGVPCRYMATDIPNSCLEQVEIIINHTKVRFKHKLISINGAAITICLI